MKHSKDYNVAVIGATGNAGMETLQILAERNFPVADIFAVASERSIGKVVSFKNRDVKVQLISDIDFSKVDIAIFCAGSSFSRKYAPVAAKAGCVVIDKTAYFRLNPKVPLVIPEVNIKALHKGAPLGIISTPNCVAVPLTMTLKALLQLSPIKRVVVSTYQSVSGAGRKAIDELYAQSKAVLSTGPINTEVFPKQIAFNVIPQIGDVYENGVTDEEDKISGEVCKILKSDVKVAVTCVRVPSFIGHGMSVACEFAKEVTEEDVYEVFNNFEGIVTIDRRNENGIVATPIDSQGEDAVYVSRIRKDCTVKSGILYWAVSDNLRKGAALNSVQIAEEVITIDSDLGIFKAKE